MDSEEKEKIPVLSLADATRWRKKLRAIFIPKLVGELLDSSMFHDAVTEINKLVTKAAHVQTHDDTHPDHQDIIRPVIEKTLSNLIAGRVLDMSWAEHVINRLAGGMWLLKSGIPLYPWAGQLKEEWVLTMIRSATYYTTPRRNIPGAMLEFYVITGTPADMSFTQFFPDFMLRKMAIKLKILERKNNRFLHHRELVKHYVLLKLEIGSELKASKFQERDALNKRNKIRAKRRSEYKTKCPRQSKWPCHFCPAGYVSCPLGTHKNDYVLKQCPGGHEGWYPDTKATGRCLSCQAKHWWGQRG